MRPLNHPTKFVILVWSSMYNPNSSLSRYSAFHLRNIYRIRRFLDFDSCNDVIRSLILSRLDYGNVLLWVPTPLISKLLKIWAAKLFFFASKKNHASPLLCQIHWLPVRDRITFKVLLYVFKCLAGTGPGYLSSCLELYNPTREGFWSASDGTGLTVPIIRGWTFESAADKTITYTAPNAMFGTNCRLLYAVLNQCMCSKRDSNFICFSKCIFWLRIFLVFFIYILQILCHRAGISGNGVLNKVLLCLSVCIKCMYKHLSSIYQLYYQWK